MNNHSEKINHFLVAPSITIKWWKNPLALWAGGLVSVGLAIGLGGLTNTVMGGSGYSLHGHTHGLTQKVSLKRSMDGESSPHVTKEHAHLSHGESSHHNHVMEHAGHDEGGKGEYDLIVKAGEARANKPVTLLMKPTYVNNQDAKVSLAVVHEKKIHLLIVSKDLSYFAHEHPAEKEEGYYVLNHTFPKGGEYFLFVDYTPVGSHENIKRHHMSVTSDQAHEMESNADAVVKAQDLTWEANGYRVSLARKNGSGSFAANTPVILKANVTKNGRAVKDLSPFLGALAHMAIFSKDAQEYLHVHPLEAVGEGPDILLATNFTNPGLYKIWMGFNHQNKIQTSAFVVQAH